MNVSLTAELEEYVRRKVASGLYNNASEVIREALRLHVESGRASPSRRDRESPRKDEVVAELAALEKPLRQRGLTSLALFGSVVHSAAHPDSDIDLLVDVVTRGGLEPAIRDRVLREAETVF
jgi:putative addiction module CopG family antidote